MVPSSTPSSGVAAPLSLHTSLWHATQHLLSLQQAQGGWEGEMVWNSMILSQHIITRHLIGRTESLDDKTRAQMIQHYRVTRTRQGGWGMHGESDAYVYFTTLAYVALRLLGVSPDDPLCADARRWLQAQPDGVLRIPTWGKLWLAMCDLYDYAGVNPFPPEMFLLPRSVPLSPFTFYCHTRYIYLGVAYLYGRRFRGNLGAMRDVLRRELYVQPYHDINFRAHRHAIAATDLYVPPTRVLRLAYDVLYAYEQRPSRLLRARALDFCFDRLLFEQRASRYQGLSPVNSLLNTLALYDRDPQHPALADSLAGQEAWRWEDKEEGLRYAGARSQTWDTAFALQTLRAVAKAGIGDAAARDVLDRATQRGHDYLASLQLQEPLDGGPLEERQSIVGGWCFSDGVHRWPVSDCTAESVVGLLQAEEQPGITPLPLARIESALRFVLSRQNDDGGFGTYERRRGASFLEHINPSEMYGSCMTERSYLECTASSLRGLGVIRSTHGHRLSAALSAALATAIDKGQALLLGTQRSDGSWPGFWGINFTYAIFHVVKALIATGLSPEHPALSRAAEWLLAHQKADGGWGEHYASCLTEQYQAHPITQVVMTSWALLTLCELSGTLSDTQRDALDRAAGWLQSMQCADGSFPQQAQNGVFFGTAMLDYRLYKSYFPVWALARYQQVRGEKIDSSEK